MAPRLRLHDLPLLLALGCALASCGDPAPAEVSEPPAAAATPPEGGPAMDRDQGQQHPPLPADNPVWEWDAGGFVPDYGWYGEHSWADVRMRVAGHLSVAGRDKARVLAEQGDVAGAAEAYADLSQRLEALELPDEGVSAEIGALLRAAATRDATTLTHLAMGQAPPVPQTGELAPLRARLLGVAVAVQGGAEADVAELSAIQQAALEAARAERADLDITAFEDFDSRHELRVKLFAAYLDSLDPLGLDEPWGYWTDAERRRQAMALFYAAGFLGGTVQTPEDPALIEQTGGVPPGIGGLVTPLRAASWYASVLRTPDQRQDFTVEGLGWLPTGDALIDVGAEPGPKAIGSLERLGLDDPEHAAFLGEWEARLDAALAEDPATVPALVAELTGVLDAHGHGSRYYNIKQARNEAVRVLARHGHPALAVEVLETNQPLHNQDWACPNRVGILEGLEGRLLAEAGQPEAALEALDQSLKSGAVFLDQVGQAEALGPRAPGNRPPAMGGPGGPGKGGKVGGHPPPRQGPTGGRPGPPPPRGGSKAP